MPELGRPPRKAGPMEAARARTIRARQPSSTAASMRWCAAGSRWSSAGSKCKQAPAQRRRKRADRDQPRYRQVGRDPIKGNDRPGRRSEGEQQVDPQHHDEQGEISLMHRGADPLAWTRRLAMRSTCDVPWSVVPLGYNVLGYAAGLVSRSLLGLGPRSLPKSRSKTTPLLLTDAIGLADRLGGWHS